MRIPFAFGLFAALLTAVAAAESKTATRPNIVIMMVDDMGFAGPSIAPYGNPHYKTPGMDRLAREGMLFSDFHASGAICSATRAGFLPGSPVDLDGLTTLSDTAAASRQNKHGVDRFTSKVSPPQPP